MNFEKQVEEVVLDFTTETNNLYPGFKNQQIISRAPNKDELAESLLSEKVQV